MHCQPNRLHSPCRSLDRPASHVANVPLHTCLLVWLPAQPFTSFHSSLSSINSSRGPGKSPSVTSLTGTLPEYAPNSSHLIATGRCDTPDGGLYESTEAAIFSWLENALQLQMASLEHHGEVFHVAMPIFVVLVWGLSLCVDVPWLW